jgi:hypothetical protein
MAHVAGSAVGDGVTAGREGELDGVAIALGVIAAVWEGLVRIDWAADFVPQPEAMIAIAAAATHMLPARIRCNHSFG